MIKLMLKIKIRDGISRPYFSINEHLDLMKELGFGMYSADRYKCSFCCNKTYMEGMKLSLCLKCKWAWYCGPECTKKAWKSWYRKTCGMPLVAQTLTLPLPMMQQVFKYIEIFAAPISFGPCKDVRVELFLCRDPSTGGIFNALTNIVYMTSKKDLHQLWLLWYTMSQEGLVLVGSSANYDHMNATTCLPPFSVWILNMNNRYCRYI